MTVCIFRLDKRIEQLEKEQRDKMKKWTDKTEPLDKWLVKNETVVESNEPIGYDINYVKGQSGDAQVGFHPSHLPLVLLTDQRIILYFSGNDHRPASGAA